MEFHSTPLKHLMPSYTLTYSLHSSNTYFPRRLPEGCPKAARNLPEGCPKAARNLPEGCPKAEPNNTLYLNPFSFQIYHL
ncbi:MAG: hypothetical protein MJ001_03860 [Paludibacteraceae bacterium]|nr:hypothetical protein [Paludibacteraceae bacterium]